MQLIKVLKSKHARLNAISQEEAQFLALGGSGRPLSQYEGPRDAMAPPPMQQKESPSGFELESLPEKRESSKSVTWP